MTELAWWSGLSGDDLRVNTEGDPPYDASRVAALVADRLGTRGRVLDLGCGTGRLTAAYLAVSDAEVVGFDPAMLTEARRRLPAVSFTDSMPDGPFDGAYSVTVFQHLPHSLCAEHVAAVAARLRPGGRFVFQYVDGVEDVFLSHQASEDLVRSWCADLTVIAIDRDPVYEEWRWVTTQA